MRERMMLLVDIQEICEKEIERIDKTVGVALMNEIVRLTVRIARCPARSSSFVLFLVVSTYVLVHNDCELPSPLLIACAPGLAEAPTFFIFPFSPSSPPSPPLLVLFCCS